MIIKSFDMDGKELGFECEMAIAFLCAHMVNEGWKKPSLFHSVRVGTYLFEHGYERNIVIAGFLHDVIEDGVNVSEEEIATEFGVDVLRIVMANTKDRSIKDEKKIKEELIDRCIAAGREAMIVKAGDILDNFFYYRMTRNADEILYHCMPLAGLLLEKKPDNITDDIFDQLAAMMNKCDNSS